MLVACYGSLKKGYYNHGALGDDAEFLGKDSVRAVMYSNGAYPKLYKVELEADGEGGLNAEYVFDPLNSRNHELEIYQVNDRAYKRIDQMELGAGYEAEQIDTEWGPATIYYMPHENFNSEDKWVEKY